MKFMTLFSVECAKLKRSRILILLFLPVFLMWLPAIVNADLNFRMGDVGISPEHNLLIQGFMGMAWFMIPATLLICTVLLNQTERMNRGLLKMLTLPVSRARLSLAKFLVIVLLAALQMLMSIAAYYVAAAAASRLQDYPFLLPLPLVCRVAGKLYLTAVPMAAVFWALATGIHTPIFALGIGLASIVPCILLINTKIWFAYPMSYPFYMLMTEYGAAAEGIFDTAVQLVPWIPTAAGLTAAALAVSCFCFGRQETHEP